MVSGKNTDKSKLFEIFHGELPATPMIKECTLNMECKFLKKIKLPTNTLFLGEIINAYSEERYLVNGIPDIAKMQPMMLTMPDKKYWHVGKYFQPAWQIGKK